MQKCKYCPKTFSKIHGKGGLVTHQAAHKAQKNRKKKSSSKKISNKKLLEAKDCLELCSILAKIFSYTKTSIRKDEENILGKYGNTFWKSEDQEFKLLPFPRIPNTLSEPIIIHLLKNKKPIPMLAKFEFVKGSLNGNKADISATYGKTVKKIQAKGTGKNDFITMGKKDMNSDFFIWLRFTDAFVKNNFSSLSMIIVEKPRKHKKLREWSKKSNKLTFEQLKSHIGKYNSLKINLNTEFLI